MQTFPPVRALIADFHAYDAAHPRPATQPGPFRRLAATGLQFWRRRKMTKMLEALSDDTLDDIGIVRGDIPRVVEGFDTRELRMTPLAYETAGQRVEYDQCKAAA